MYGKIFDSMYDGTLRGHWQAIVTLQQMIVLADSNGVVDMTAEAISSRTTIPLKIIRAGIEHLMQADPYTRTPGDDGRRIVLVDDHRPWGWRLVNHAKYRGMRNMAEKREADRVRISEKRQQINGVATSRQMSQMSPMQYADTNTSNKGAELPEWVPLDAWDAWLEVRKKSRAPNTPRALKLAVAELARLKAQGNDVRAVLEQSTLRGWRGLFEVRDSRQQKPGKVAMP